MTGCSVPEFLEAQVGPERLDPHYAMHEDLFDGAVARDAVINSRSGLRWRTSRKWRFTGKISAEAIAIERADVVHEPEAILDGK